MSHIRLSPFAPVIRNDWQREEIAALYDLPFNDLLFQAQQTHRHFFDPNEIQVSTLISIKTGNCPEDCGYCSQSGHHDSQLQAEKKLAVAQVIEAARQAREQGASRFCMGAAWRNPHERDMPYIVELVKEVRALGLETCMTLGMLTAQQAQTLADAGLDYYNHNLDTSPEHYPNIIHTRTYDSRLQTLEHVRQAGLRTCTGGILGLGESRADRVGLLHALATQPVHPDSVPLNMLVPIPGTPLADAPPLPVLEWIRTIAVARCLMPHAWIRLSAGRQQLTDAEQALAFAAGANSLFYGDKLLTTGNNDRDTDQQLWQELGLRPVAATVRQSPEDEAAALMAGSRVNNIRVTNAMQTRPRPDHE